MQEDYAGPVWAEHHLQLGDALHRLLRWSLRRAARRRRSLTPGATLSTGLCQPRDVAPWG
jgi:hypothetical protein